MCGDIVYMMKYRYYRNIHKILSTYPRLTDRGLDLFVSRKLSENRKHEQKTQ